MKNGRTLSARDCVLVIAAAAIFASLATACGAPSESTGAPAPSSAAPHRIAASATTKEAFGVDHWSRQESTGDTVISGEAADGTVRVRFEQVITTDGAGVTHGVITADIDGSPTLRYTVSADGEGKVERNDFPKSTHAVEAARDALADLQASTGSLVQTRSVAPLDLVRPGSPLLETGGRCGAAIAATVCIVAALCGLGGPAGAEVLAATVEAGTEQCR